MRELSLCCHEMSVFRVPLTDNVAILDNLIIVCGDLSVGFVIFFLALGPFVVIFFCNRRYPPQQKSYALRGLFTAGQKPIAHGLSGSNCTHLAKLVSKRTLSYYTNTLEM